MTDHWPEKPREGEPCNGCGACCVVSLCCAAQEALGPQATAPCPFIVDDGECARCRMVATEEAWGMEPVIATGLGIGMGCSMEDDTDD